MTPTPSEKAKGLYDRFYNIIKSSDTCLGICESVPIQTCDKQGNGCGLWKDYAKQCALICVEEMIAENSKDAATFFKQLVEYWTKVKEEIQKL